MTVESELFGQGDYRYRYVENWLKLPEGRVMGDVAGVAIDARDNVYVFSRDEHPLSVFDREGNYLRGWGEGVFTRPHALHVGLDEAIYCTDDTGHCIRKYTLDGKLLMTIGTPGVSTEFGGGQPFCRCCHTALAPNGDIFVADGYGNARIHRFSPDGKLLHSWGDFGTGPGEFNIVHNITCDANGWVYVADRENGRIQVFDGNGRFETEWHNLFRPNGLFMPPGVSAPVCYICEGRPEGPVNKRYPNIGGRVTIMDNDGKVISRFGRAGEPSGKGTFMSPHGIGANSRGDIFIGEVANHSYRKFHKDEPVPQGLVVFHKYERVA